MIRAVCVCLLALCAAGATAKELPHFDGSTILVLMPGEALSVENLRIISGDLYRETAHKTPWHKGGVRLTCTITVQKGTLADAELVCDSFDQGRSVYHGKTYWLALDNRIVRIVEWAEYPFDKEVLDVAREKLLGLPPKPEPRLTYPEEKRSHPADAIKFF